jgi:diaminopimelate epimerase
MKIEFAKMSGAGNDFVLLGPAYEHLIGHAPELARNLCARRTSIGADGLIIVEDSNKGIVMHYFNSDGSEAPFCGNGARCLVYFCTVKGIASSPVTFRSDSGIHSGEVTERSVRISMQAPALSEETSIDIEGKMYDIALVDAGVPHAVMLIGSLDSVDVQDLGKKIRNHPRFGSEGANADFVDTGQTGVFSIRTYERGVERETLACGSGCVAAAHLLRLKGLGGDSVALRVASGDVLTVDFAGDDFSQVYLSGPVRIVYEGEIQVKE